MAKSLRSKWRRKCRAVKRIRYGEKELAMLKKTLGIDETSENLVTMIDPKPPKEKNVQVRPEESNGMETDRRLFNPTTLRDQHGTYPVWVHPRKIRKNKKLQKKLSKRKR